MLTKFGKLVRKYRIDRQMKLGEMSTELEISAAHLSGLETGRKNLTQDLLTKIANILNLDEGALNELKIAADESRTEHRIKMANKKEYLGETVAMFARSIDSSTLTKDKADRIKEILMS